MVDVTAELIADRFQRGIVDTRSEWSLLVGRMRALDVINHVLRVILQLNQSHNYVEEFECLAALQHEDGGWSDITSGQQSGVRNTCFAARNLIRANRVLQRHDFRAVAEKAVRFVLGQQDEAGFWPDVSWGPRDATSSGMGLLLYARKEQFGEATQTIHENARMCLERAAAYLEQTQASDGSWPDTTTYESSIGPTSHLLPKLVLFSERLTPTITVSIDLLIREQEVDGSWDHQHTDHTCDATRALLLTNSVISDLRLPTVIKRAVSWLVDNHNDDGFWGEHPNEPSSLLMSCDVLDCFSKYSAHIRSHNLRAFWE